MQMESGAVKLKSARRKSSLYAISFAHLGLFSLDLCIPSFGDFKETSGTRGRPFVCHNWEKFGSLPLPVCLHA